MPPPHLRRPVCLPACQPSAQRQFRVLSGGGLAPSGPDEQLNYVNFYASLIKEVRQLVHSHTQPKAFENKGFVNPQTHICIPVLLLYTDSHTFVLAAAYLIISTRVLVTDLQHMRPHAEPPTCA